MNEMQVALEKSGLGERKRKRNRRRKPFKCNSCGADMNIVDDTNVMACSQCGNYFIFDKNMGE